MFGYYKSSCAKRRNLVFEIDFDYFKTIVRQPCNYCGKSGKLYPNGLDRVDSLKGYKKENIVPCCTKCNVMKMALDVNDFVDHCKKITEHQKRR